MTGTRLEASFRDPGGFVFRRDGVVLRQVNRAYQEDYDRLMRGGLYDALVERGLLVPHEEVDGPGLDERAYRVLHPEQVPVVTYPYEWSFSQLRDAARVTLDAQRLALQHGMLLKDASAFNVQFVRGRPMLIDTLSFRARRDDEPWPAYRQFCRHFLAPLALMAHVDPQLGRLLQVHLDGVPLPLASVMLPMRARLSRGLLLHLVLHARLEAAPRARLRAPPRVRREALEGLAASLRGAVDRLPAPRGRTRWGDYDPRASYPGDAAARKRDLLDAWIARLRPSLVWDLGGNVGEFSRVATTRGSRVVCLDGDPLAVERNYAQASHEGDERMLPLVADVSNPSPGLGWRGRERLPLLERAAPDLVLMLAVVHHLVIDGNASFRMVADLLASLAPACVVEFVPPDDPQVREMTALRPESLDGYDEEAFRRAFETEFHVVERQPIPGSARVLYLFRRNVP